MDYTTIARVKSAMQIDRPKDDALMALLVTSASRAIDYKCAGAPDADVENYLAAGSVSDEKLYGRLDSRGNLSTHPRKPVITDVSALAYRFKPMDSWMTVAANRLAFNGPKVEAYTELTMRPAQVFIQISYTGGVATETSGSPTGPANLIEAATVLAARYYKEAEAKLADSIGVAELGMLIYTQAWPVRVLDMLVPYMRHVPWRGTL